MKKWLWVLPLVALSSCKTREVDSDAAHWVVSEDKHSATINVGDIEPGQWAGRPAPKNHYILNFELNGHRIMRVFGSFEEQASYLEGMTMAGFTGEFKMCCRVNKHEDEVSPCAAEGNMCE